MGGEGGGVKPCNSGVKVDLDTTYSMYASLNRIGVLDM